MQRYSKALVAGAALSSSLSTVNAALYEKVVNIPNYGPVQGTAALNESYAYLFSNYKDISFFGGVPFGADTSGSNRWTAPKKRAAWNSTIDATAFGPICPQGISQLAAYGESEDCLTVNIWTPANYSGEKLPVAVWSYGAGTAPPQTTYNGAGMAAQGIVFVTFNYRAGAFGFMASSELTAESSYNASGNWGVLDQYAAVRWVKDNIAAFGGNPEHITAVGQSFGAAGVYHQVNTDLLEGVLVGAIAESGVRDPYDPNVAHYECEYGTLADGEALGAQLLEALNVSTIAGAREFDYTEILAASSAANLDLSFLPVLDFYAIPETYADTLVKGAGNKVPFITGNNKDEDGASSTLTTTVADYKTWLNSTYGTYADEFLALYPADNDTQAALSETAIVIDSFRVSSWLYMDNFAKSSDVETYTYYWTHAPPGSEGASHASEIPYALNNLFNQGANYTAEDYWIADRMSSYWANFIKTGNPNQGNSYTNGSLPAWGANSNTKNQTFQIGSELKEIAIADADKVELIVDFFSVQTPF